jgi:hypothetical protein
MRVIMACLFLFNIAGLAQATTLQDDRRVEEQKRTQLKATEAQYYDLPLTNIKKEGRADIDYFNTLIAQRVATYADAAYVMSILLGKADELTSFQERKQYLTEYGFLPKRRKDSFTEDYPLSRGLIAYMLFKALDLKGGLTVRILGPGERYTLQELVFEGIMLSGSTKELISGKELAYTFIQAANYISKYRTPVK